METSNNSVSTREKQPSNIKNIIIGVMAAVILVLGGFLIYNQSKAHKDMEVQQAEVVRATTEKSELQASFDASLARLDSMTTSNNTLKGELEGRDSEIAKMKAEIRSILNKRNASDSELKKAKNLIAQLNGKISSLEAQIAALTNENDSLRAEREGFLQEREVLARNLDSTTQINTNLAQKVDIASTLNASNIKITPVKVKNNGKEKVKTVAKKVDKLIVSFDLRNRIVQTGETELYVVVIDPDGQPVTDAAGSGVFTTRQEGQQAFTAKLPVTMETGKVKNVEFGFAPGDHFKKGTYTIKIYQNGFLIGQGKQELKKGFLG